MELKSLVLGLVLSMGAFALKAGIGMGYLMADNGTWPRQAGRTLAFAAGYGLVFLMAWAIIAHVDMTARLDRFTLLFKSGMTLHLILAVLIMIWGAGLLTSRKATGGKRPQPSRVWMALAIPCPVCFTVILLSSGFLAALYPDQTWILAGLYLGFVLTGLSSAFLISRVARGRAEAVLGTLMIYISGYFMLSVLLVPQWADLNKIYRLSLPETSDIFGPLLVDTRWAILTLFILITFCLGFFMAPKKETV